MSGVKVEIQDGPHQGRMYRFAKHPPFRIYLPVWPEPDLKGPPYRQAEYQRVEMDQLVEKQTVHYKHIRTFD